MMEHTTLLYIIYSPHLFFHSNLHISDLYYIIVYIIYCVFAVLYIAYLYIVLLLSVSCCCHSVALWSFCHYNKFLVCVNIPGNKAHSDSDSDSVKGLKNFVFYLHKTQVHMLPCLSKSALLFVLNLAKKPVKHSRL